MDNSALDTRDYDEAPPLGATAQRRPSRKSDRARSLKESQSQQQPPSRPRLEMPNVQSQLAPQPEPPAWQASQASGPALRRRVNSQLHRPDMTPGMSPLAQVFQPLVMDDDASKDGLPQSHFVSYGPASRRRLASMQSMRHPTNLPNPTPTAQRRPPWPVTGSRREPSDDPGLLSGSPEQNVQPETAEEAEETSFEESSMVRWFKHMESMEERQKRIEDILLELTGRTHRSSS